MNRNEYLAPEIEILVVSADIITYSENELFTLPEDEVDNFE